jgi:DNA-binding beta-propeller fold protein YncE
VTFLRLGARQSCVWFSFPQPTTTVCMEAGADAAGADAAAEADMLKKEGGLFPKSNKPRNAATKKNSCPSQPYIRALCPFGNGWLIWTTSGGIYTGKIVHQKDGVILEGVKRLAGHADDVGFVDGTGDQARIRCPTSIAVNYLATHACFTDTGNDAVRTIDLNTNEVTTLAGQGGRPGNEDGVGAKARFWSPRGCAYGREGQLYVADKWNHCVRIVQPDGQTTTLHVELPGVEMMDPVDVAVGSDRSIFVADCHNNCIRRIDPTDGTVTMYAGGGRRMWDQDAGEDGDMQAARLYRPRCVETGVGNVLYFSEEVGGGIRSVSPAGDVTTPITNASSVLCLKLDPAGKYIYVSRGRIPGGFGVLSHAHAHGSKDPTPHAQPVGASDHPYNVFGTVQLQVEPGSILPNLDAFDAIPNMSATRPPQNANAATSSGSEPLSKRPRV